MKVLAISGSLRASSSNTAILEAAVELAPPGIEVVMSMSLGALPHFNPDLDQVNTPPVVLEFRNSIAGADAILISTPEYAHGIPGSLKNALDWLVSDIHFPGKRVGLIFGSATAGSFAQTALVEVLKTMSAWVDSEAIANIPGVRGKLGSDGKLIDPEAIEKVRRVLMSFLNLVTS